MTRVEAPFVSPNQQFNLRLTRSVIVPRQAVSVVSEPIRDRITFSSGFSRRRLLQGGFFAALASALPNLSVSKSASTAAPSVFKPSVTPPPSSGVASNVLLNAARQHNGHYERELLRLERELKMAETLKLRRRRQEQEATSVRAQVLAGTLKALDGTYDSELDAYEQQLSTKKR